MKKLITLAAGVLLIGMTARGANSIDPVIPGTVTIAASQGTNTTSDIMVGNADGFIGAREIESFTVYNYSGTGTGTVTLIMIDEGVETTIYNTGSLVPGASAVVYPERTLTESSVAGYIVTNYPVFYEAGGAMLATTGSFAVASAPVTNSYLRSVLAATTTTTTKYAPYKVRTAKVRVTQPNAATADVYKWAIKTQ